MKNEINIKAMMEGIGILIIDKNKDYGSASFTLGLKGSFVHLHDKIKRLESLIWKEQEPKLSESILDTYKDIIGYAVIGLCICKLQVRANSQQEYTDLINNVKLVLSDEENYADYNQDQ